MHAHDDLHQKNHVASSHSPVSHAELEKPDQAVADWKRERELVLHRTDRLDEPVDEHRQRRRRARHTWFDGHFAPVLHPQGEHVGP